MKRATPQMRNVATRLMTLETSGDGSSERTTRAAFDACEKLRPQLATLMGNGGFRALLARSLALASEEVRWLRAVQVKSDGSLTGWQEPHAQLLPEEFHEGGNVLLAQLLGLMVAFIGEDLTVRLLREIWPTLPLSLDGGKGDGNEKAK